MKKTAFIILMIISAATSMTGCQKDEDPTQSISSSNTASLPGNWKVIYYFDNNKDETIHYSNYTFEFTAGGGFVAMQSSQTFQGSWQETVDDSLPRLVLAISGNNDLLELSDDWVIIKMTDTEIWLEDDNNTKKEELRFVKIN